MTCYRLGPFFLKPFNHSPNWRFFTAPHFISSEFLSSHPKFDPCFLMLHPLNIISPFLLGDFASQKNGHPKTSILHNFVPFWRPTVEPAKSESPVENRSTGGQHPILWVETTHPKLVVYRISLAHPQHVLRLFFPDPHQVFETWAYQPMIYHIPFILRHRRQSFLVKSLKSPTLNIFSIIFHHFSNIFVQFVPLLEPIFLDLL